MCFVSLIVLIVLLGFCLFVCLHVVSCWFCCFGVGFSCFVYSIYLFLGLLVVVRSGFFLGGLVVVAVGFF